MGNKKAVIEAAITRINEKQGRKKVHDAILQVGISWDSPKDPDYLDGAYWKEQGWLDQKKSWK